LPIGLASVILDPTRKQPGDVGAELAAVGVQETRPLLELIASPAGPETTEKLRLHCEGNAGSKAVAW
jgi:hypothetical protein